MSARLLLVAVVALLGSTPAGAQQVTKESVPGVTNFARVETSIASRCSRDDRDRRSSFVDEGRIARDSRANRRSVAPRASAAA